eukprot:UN00070
MRKLFHEKAKSEYGMSKIRRKVLDNTDVFFDVNGLDEIKFENYVDRCSRVENRVLLIEQFKKQAVYSYNEQSKKGIVYSFESTEVMTPYQKVSLEKGLV